MITPIEYDNSMDGDAGADMLDVTYPMPHIAGDSVGGFWTESAGSWLHIDEDDTATRRFNLDGEKAFLRVRGISAMDSSTLVVSGHVDGEREGGLWLFDTTAMTWTPIATDASIVGDVAVVGRTVFYVEILYDAVGDISFVVRRLDDATADPIVTPQLDVDDGERVKLSVTPDLSVIADTGSRLLAIDSAGEVSQLSEFPAGTPVTTTTTAGTTAWATAPRVTDESWYVDGGSSDARRVIETNEFCDPRSIETSQREVSPPLCNIQAMEWVDANTLIVSAGTEGGSILAKLRMP
ncbi:hypothetical protein LZG07_03765 [Microbacterium profundi]|uniref:hypothetical protein n=1 Tax=Microbacterium profundi TaxID=450380 RepID=UPI0019D1BD6B|nr:hypothetical protein [Microbacterium profundi]MCE7481048.1 hypothetical protein [Microbacterium profundi]